MPKEVGKLKRLELLIERGYFPKELPPPFTTRVYASNIGAISKKLNAESPKSQYETFSYPRTGINRRHLAITNPISQLHLSRFIAQNWIQIRKRLKQTKVSVFSPLFSVGSERAFADLQFHEIERLKIHMAANHNRFVATDVARFYPSIYTHSIAWTLHGKGWCKKNLNKPAFKSSLGNKLDALCRKCQDNQSLGIPIGPDTSRVMAELIGVGIDEGLPKSGTSRDIIFRFTDDIVVGLESTDASDTIISGIAKSLSEFGLELNESKTRIVELHSDRHSEWHTELRRIRLPHSGKRQESAIEHFFKLAFAFARDNPDDNILNYAVKRTRSMRVSSANWKLYESFLLRIARANATTVPDMAQIIIDANHRGLPVNSGRIAKFCEEIIDGCAPRRHDSEVAWCLFLLKALRVSVLPTVMRAVESLNSSVCALILLDLESRHLTKRKVDRTLWLPEFSEAGLYDQMWLLVYEATIKGWINAGPKDFIAKDKNFGVLWDKKVYFYDENKNVLKIRAELRRMRAFHNARLRISQLF